MTVDLALNSFSQAIVYVLKNEGGFVDNPSDKGGPTNYGITEADYSLFKGHPITDEEVKEMPVSDAESIYRAKYWNKYMDALDVGVATAIMDWGVLHGTINAHSLAQTTANLLGANPPLLVDGFLKETSVNTINKLNPNDFILKYSAEVKKCLDDRVKLHPSQKVFLSGWNARADRMKTLIEGDK